MKETYRVLNRNRIIANEVVKITCERVFDFKMEIPITFIYEKGDCPNITADKIWKELMIELHKLETKWHEDTKKRNHDKIKGEQKWINKKLKKEEKRD